MNSEMVFCHTSLTFCLWEGGGERGEGVERDIYFIIPETKRKRDILHLTLFLKGQWHEIYCRR
jgi:hypothetical protein